MTLISGFIRIILKLDTVEQLKGWRPGWKAFDEVVKKITDEYSMVFNADVSLDTSDDVLKHSKLFIRDALTFWVFSDAVRYEDAGTMWLVYNFWLFMFRGAGCHNYGNELLEMVAQFSYEMSASLREIMERTWLVNRWGKLGRAIPTDRYLEINNGFIKARRLAHFVKNTNHTLQNLFAASPSCASISYIQEKGSGPVELLRKLSRDVAAYFDITDVQRKHSEVNKQADIRALVMDLMDASVHTLIPGRTIPQAGPNKGNGIVDIFTEGKEVLERAAFRNWKDRTAKFGPDVFGCDLGVVGQQGVDGEVDMGSQDSDVEDEALVEFDPLADPELEGEI